MSTVLTSDEYVHFRELVEAQSPRQLRRFLDYGKRVRQGSGMSELVLWVGRILFDRDHVYTTQDKAAAFEIGACEWLARRWGEVSQPGAEAVTIAGPIDKVRLLRMLLVDEQPAARCALAALFAQRYGRTWSWVRERAAQPVAYGTDDDAPLTTGATRGEEAVAAEDALFARFLQELEALDPLPLGSGAVRLERLLADAQEREQRLRRELEVATERAERAVTRLESVQEEVRQLRHDLREGRQNGDQLREERSRRIKTERQARDAARELERLRAEYVKLDGRLREAARRRADGGGAGGWDLAALGQQPPAQLLGLGPDASAEDLAQARRRFAAAFHSDRAAQLPPWVRELFDRLLALVNASCDRVRRP